MVHGAAQQLPSLEMFPAHVLLWKGYRCLGVGTGKTQLPELESPFLWGCLPQFR